MSETRPAEQYGALTVGLDANDLRTFNSYLIGWLMGVAGAEESARALEATAAHLDRSES